MSDEGKLEKNTHTWVRDFNIIFIDQPVGVGFSYADFGETIVCDGPSFQRYYISPNSSPFGLPGNSALATKDVAVFLSIFFEHLRAFQKIRFHFFGRSYAVLEFDNIFVPCTLVSHTTGAFRGDTYRCLPRWFGIRTQS